jgi:hypothetical protein
MKNLIMITASILALSTVAFAQEGGSPSDPATACTAAKKKSEKKACCSQFKEKPAHRTCMKSK